jgi:adenylate cyclase class IV
VFLLDRLLVGGLGFVLDKVARAVDTESDDQETVREQLLDAQLRFESGEIDEDDYAEIERDCLARLRELRGGGAIVVGGKGARVEGVEIDSGGDEER